MLYRTLAVSTASLVIASGAAAQCQPEWDRTIGTPGIEGTGYILPMIVWNDGTGDKLYVGGSFRNLGGINFVAAYDFATQSWSGLGGGLSASHVSDFAIFNPGTGDKLVVSGANWTAGGVVGTRNIAMWDGQSWHSTGANMTGSSVSAVHVWDDGNGARLYAGGTFSEIGGIAANRIARWDGTTWEAIGTGMTGSFSPSVFTITSYDDGTSDALYAGGRFSEVDGLPTGNLARFDGTSWSVVGGGVFVSSATQGINELRVLDLGYGSELFASGSSFTASGQTASAARWNGQTWTALGQPLSGTVRQMVVLDEGDGPKLYAGAAGATGGGVYGFFMELDEPTNSWQTTGVHFDNTVFGVFQHADRLYVGGSFRQINDPGVGIQPVGGIITRTICPAAVCYADCDGNETLDINDFLCFIDEFASAQILPPAQQQAHYANCTGATAEPYLSVNDFLCFIDEFAAGCP